MYVRVGNAIYDVDKGYCLIEWVGEEPYLDHPWVDYQLTLGLFSPKKAALIRELRRTASLRVPRGSRILIPGHGFGEIPGLSMRHKWGNRINAEVGDPGSYIQMVTIHDAYKICESSSGHEFRVFHPEGQEQPDDPRPKLILPDKEIHIVNDRHLIKGVTWA